MLSQLLTISALQVTQTLETWSGSLAGQATLLCVGLLSSYLLWYIHRFHLRPMLYSDAIPEYPYLIPFIGHGYAFIKDSDALMERALGYFGRSFESFMLQVGRKRIYIVTAPNEVAEVYKHADTFDFTEHLDSVLENFGCTPAFIRLGRTKSVGKESCDDVSESFHQLPMLSFMERIYAKQLMPGAQMITLRSSFTESLSRMMSLGNSSLMSKCTKTTPGGNIVVSLKYLCEHALGQAHIESFFGDQLLKIAPDLIERMLPFKDTAWMLFYGMPNIMSSTALKSLQSLLEVFDNYVKLPQSQHNNRSWGVERAMAACNNIDADDQSKAAILSMLLWARSANVLDTTFWVFAHIIADKDLYGAVRAEVDRSWVDGSLKMGTLDSRSPILHSVVLEVLRTKGRIMTGRSVIAPTRIGNKTFQPGGTILIPVNQLHHNEQVWGPTRQEFEPGRFIRDPGLAKHSSYRPFGGGVSFCPGRRLAMQEICTMVAIALCRFDISINREIPFAFPKINDSKPALGIAGPAPAMDIWLDVQKRRDNYN